MCPAELPATGASPAMLSALTEAIQAVLPKAGTAPAMSIMRRPRAILIALRPGRSIVVAPRSRNTVSPFFRRVQIFRLSNTHT